MTRKYDAKKQLIVVDFTKDKDYISYNKYLDELYRNAQRRKSCKDINIKG